MIIPLDFEKLKTIPLTQLPFVPGQDVQSCSSCDSQFPSVEFNGDIHYRVKNEIKSLDNVVDLTIYYNSNTLQNDGFGLGSTFGLNQLCRAWGTPLVVSLTRGNGAPASFLHQGMGVFSRESVGLTSSITSLTTSQGDFWEETAQNGYVSGYPYDTSGAITSIAYSRDPIGNVMTYVYSAGRLTAVEEPFGRLVTFQHGTQSNISLLFSVQDWAGRITSLQYDTNSLPGTALLSTVTRPTGCTVGLGYDSFGRLDKFTNPNGFGATFSYDVNGRGAEATISTAGTTRYNFTSSYLIVTNPLNQQTTYLLGNGPFVLGMTDPLGITTTMLPNATNAVAGTVDGLGHITTVLYDSYGIHQAGIIDALGNISSYLLDPFGNNTTLILADGSISTFLYGFPGSSFDQSGEKRRLQAHVDPLGNRTSYSYDGRGQLTAIQNPLGALTTWTYDGLGNCIAVQNSLGYLTSFAYDLAGNVLTVTDPLGNLSSNTYDAQNRPLSLSNPLGQSQTMAYDSVGNLVVKIDPLGNITTTAYNVWNKPVVVQDPLGFITTCFYDALGNRVGQIDPTGSTVSWVYDRSGRLICTVDALGARNTFQYDPAGQLNCRIDPLGHRTTTVFDNAGQVTAEINAQGSIVSKMYDVRGRIRATVSPLGFISTNQYDANGRLIARTDPIGRTTTFNFRADGTIESLESPIGAKQTFLYDQAGHRIASIDARGNYHTTIFDASGRAICKIEPPGYRTTSVYDPAGRIICTIDPRSNRTSNSYDVAGRLVSVFRPVDGATTYSYDGLDRIVAILPPANPVGYVWSNIYDAAGRTIASQSPTVAVAQPYSLVNTTVFDSNGRVIARVDPAGMRTSYSLDPLGNVVAETNALGCVTSYLYDEIGRRIMIMNPRGYSTTMSYDRDNRLISVENPLGQISTYNFDPVGNGISEVDPRGVITSSTFNEIDLRVGVCYSTGTIETFQFDPTGLLLKVEDKSGSRSWSYDERRLRISDTLDGQSPMTFGYDPAGNRVSRIDSGSLRTTYSYDAQNRVAGITNWAGEKTQFVYDKDGNSNGGNWANGMGQGRSFDRAGREIERRLRFTAAFGGELAARYDGTYDRAGNLVKQVELDGTTTTYTYDALGQLLSEHRASTSGTSYHYSYVYDAAGNRSVLLGLGARSTLTYDGANRVLTNLQIDGGITTYCYDAAGNRTAESNGQMQITYTWDESSRLTAEWLASGEVTTYSYDYKGFRRLAATGLATTQYVWDGVNLYSEEPSEEGVRYYTGPPARMRHLVSTRQNGVTGFFSSDLSDSVRSIFPVAQEPVLGTQGFTAFGQVTERVGISSSCGFVGMEGYYTDRDGRIYVRQRHYDPQTSRWLSDDPLGISSSDINLSRYSMNRVPMFTDPTGLDCAWAGTFPIQLGIWSVGIQYCGEFWHCPYLNCYTGMTSYPIYCSNVDISIGVGVDFAEAFASERAATDALRILLQLLDKLTASTGLFSRPLFPPSGPQMGCPPLGLSDVKGCLYACAAVLGVSICVPPIFPPKIDWSLSLCGATAGGGFHFRVCQVWA